MKVLFAVSNEEISESIVKKYQKQYKQIISYKNVYYFNAILKELQKDKTYDRIVISEDLEAFTHTQYDQIDKFIFDKLDGISDEASNNVKGNDIPIILICADRRTKSEQILVKLFGIGIYNAIIGNDRSVDEVCRLINRPRGKKEAKEYYQIDSEEVKYEPENENDVSEMEIQNIIAHYKRLGKNEDRYVDSFNNIAAQYNDTQLRIISKFLPLNVRAVLEEQSPKYQQIMSFNNSVSKNLRQSKKEEKEGPSETLLKPKNREAVMSKPVVIPSSVNMAGTKKLSRHKPTEDNKTDVVEERRISNLQNDNIQATPQKNAEKTLEHEQKDTDSRVLNLEDFEEITDNQNQDSSKETSKENNKVKEEPEVVQPVKRGRGRPRKNPVVANTEPPVKKKRGRPRKNPLPEVETKIDNIEKEDTILPGFNDVEEKNDAILPGFDDIEENDAVLPGFDDIEENDAVLPGFDDIEEKEDAVLPGFDDVEEKEDAILPGFNYKDENDSNIDNQIQNYSQYEPVTSVQNYGTSYNTNINNQSEYRKNEYESTKDLSGLLTPDKKIVTFVGTSKNGTSFMVNNVAELMSSIGVNTAILDTTKNRNSYYIYTKNEEELRTTAAKSITGLVQGVTNGIVVNKNLTVYTSLPDENEDIYKVDEILETLLKTYSLILIDTDFDSPVGYFKQSQETYLVQTYDILTIQPLTAFLRELKAKNILDEKKLRIILNKTIKIRGVSDKTIIGGMAYYNDPAMSFMTELFDRSLIKYVSIPLDEEVYVQYLQSIIECNITLKGYSKVFMQTLKELGNMIYPVVNNKRGYQPPSVNNPSNNVFSPNMNNTLDQMKRRY